MARDRAKMDGDRAKMAKDVAKFTDRCGTSAGTPKCRPCAIHLFALHPPHVLAVKPVFRSEVCNEFGQHLIGQPLGFHCGIVRLVVMVNAVVACVAFASSMFCCVPALFGSLFVSSMARIDVVVSICCCCVSCRYQSSCAIHHSKICVE
jgi:hypothetical protein